MGFAGCEANRRVIGIGHVKDLEQLEGAAKVAACAGVLQAARTWLLTDKSDADIDEAMAAADEAIRRETG